VMTHKATEEFGAMIFLEDTDDWNAFIEAFRRAGFHAVKIKSPDDPDDPEDYDFLFVTKHADDDGSAVMDAIRSIVLSLGRGLSDMSELGPTEIDLVRAEVPHTLN